NKEFVVLQKPGQKEVSNQDGSIVNKPAVQLTENQKEFFVSNTWGLHARVAARIWMGILSKYPGHKFKLTYKEETAEINGILSMTDFGISKPAHIIFEVIGLDREKVLSELEKFFDEMKKEQAQKDNDAGSPVLKKPTRMLRPLPLWLLLSNPLQRDFDKYLNARKFLHTAIELFLAKRASVRAIELSAGLGQLSWNIQKLFYPKIRMFSQDLGNTRFFPGIISAPYIRGRIKSLAYKDGVFDLVILTFSLDYFNISLKKEIISDIYRILVPDGRVVIVLHHPKSVISQTFEEIKKGFRSYADRVRLNEAEKLGLRDAIVAHAKIFMPLEKEGIRDVFARPGYQVYAGTFPIGKGYNNDIDMVQGVIVDKIENTTDAQDFSDFLKDFSLTRVSSPIGKDMNPGVISKTGNNKAAGVEFLKLFTYGLSRETMVNILVRFSAEDNMTIPDRTELMNGLTDASLAYRYKDLFWEYFINLEGNLRDYLFTIGSHVDCLNDEKRILVNLVAGAFLVQEGDPQNLFKRRIIDALRIVSIGILESFNGEDIPKIDIGICYERYLRNLSVKQEDVSGQGTAIPFGLPSSYIRRKQFAAISGELNSGTYNFRLLKGSWQIGQEDVIIWLLGQAYGMRQRGPPHIFLNITSDIKTAQKKLLVPYPFIYINISKRSMIIPQSFFSLSGDLQQELFINAYDAFIEKDYLYKSGSSALLNNKPGLFARLSSKHNTYLILFSAIVFNIIGLISLFSQKISLAGSLFIISSALFAFFASLNLNLIMRLESHSIIDGLTGIFNRRYLDNKFREEWLRSKRSLKPVSFLIIDVDYFKEVNDSLGHQIGDKVLIEIASLIQKCVREIDFTARYGGEEFAVILPGADSRILGMVAGRIRNNIGKYAFDIGNGQSISITVSIGGSTFPSSAEDKEELVKQADNALYKAKVAGRNRFKRFSLGKTSSSILEPGNSKNHGNKVVSQETLRLVYMPYAKVLVCARGFFQEWRDSKYHAQMINDTLLARNLENRISSLEERIKDSSSSAISGKDGFANKPGFVVAENLTSTQALGLIKNGVNEFACSLCKVLSNFLESSGYGFDISSLVSKIRKDIQETQDWAD
ncbi:MAG: diguanylate cyclase, partial [Candidatus Omnitrophica bacterium]|nr:diguanylate cyclase [Candidatus Omnitrophota bacterium]